MNGHRAVSFISKQVINAEIGEQDIETGALP
jgi:hypothetical protein